MIVGGNKREAKELGRFFKKHKKSFLLKLVKDWLQT